MADALSHAARSIAPLTEEGREGGGGGVEGTDCRLAGVVFNGELGGM